MNAPQFEQTAPTGRRRIPKFVMLLIGLLVIAGLAAISLPLLARFNAAETSAATDKPAADALMTAIDGRLDRLEKLVRDLTAKVAASNETQVAIKGDVAALREEFGALHDRLDKEAAERAAKASVAQRVAVQRRRIVKVAPPPTPTAAVLSVDMWGGKPSVALRGPDGRVQFANTGDRVPGGGVIGAVQHKGQTVTIRQADGSVSTMTSKEMQQ